MEQQTMTSGRALGAALKPRQLTMMGLGSAIGAGLFIGSGAGIQAAGPAVLISYHAMPANIQILRALQHACWPGSNRGLCLA